MKREYLGDGLYVEISGGMIRLFTERGTGTHEVFLEPKTLDAFLVYIEKLKEGQS